MSDYNLWLIISICTVFILGYIWSACIHSGSVAQKKTLDKTYKKTNREGVYKSKFVRDGAEDRIRRRMAK